jgi:predicted NACHT family NTPase
MEEENEFENIWARYGLKDTPYNAKALSLIGTLDISQVFFGRKSELKLLGDRFFSNNSTRTAVVGEVGTGKTTFVNYLRWKLCRQKSLKETKFLTTINEIKIREDWTFNKFLRETLFEIYDSSKIFKWEEEGIKLKTLEVIKDNLDLFKKKTLEISETEGMKLKSLMHQKSRRYQLAIQNL